MTHANLTQPCTCGHSAKNHAFTRKAGGCTCGGNCSCIAYRSSDPVILTGEALALEMQHWSHHVGSPPNTAQMTPEQCNVALIKEQEFQRPTILERQIAECKHYMDVCKGNIATTIKEMREAEKELGTLQAKPQHKPKTAKPDLAAALNAWSKAA